MDSNFESVNSTDNIKEILDEVHYSENINECRKKEILIYENEYIISKNEAYEGLKNSGMIKTAGTRIVIYTVILLLAIAGFIAAYVIRNNINDLIFSFISLAVLVIIWLIPHFSLDKLAKMQTAMLLNLKYMTEVCKFSATITAGIFLLIIQTE